MADTPDRPRSRSSSHVTLDDVARACGVSPITVSRALRGARNVAPELQARVQAAVDQLGYVPNVAARALASASSSTKSWLVSDGISTATWELRAEASARAATLGT